MNQRLSHGPHHAALNRPAPVESNLTLAGTRGTARVDYWDESFLSKSRLLNSQTRTYERVHTTLVRTEEIAVNGRPTEARRYALEGASFRIDLWYSLDGDWLALESRTSGGSLLRFSRTHGAAGLHSTRPAR